MYTYHMEAILLTDILTDIFSGSARSDILIKGDRIARIAPAGTLRGSGEVPSGTRTVDCAGKAAVPGFVNMHTHAAMSLMRGIQEDVQFTKWIDNIWKIESRLDSDFVYWGTKAAVLEMIMTGTTTFNDQYWFSPAAHRAAVEMGIRPVISYVVLDKNNEEEARRQMDQCERMYTESLSWKDGSMFAMAFHAIYSVSEKMILWTSDFARKHSLKLHIHLSETSGEVKDCREAHGGLTPVEYLDRLGVLDENVIAAHSLWLTDNDIDILGRRRVNCVHNINSNAKLASGYRFLYNELRDAGANVCIGTDGCASSNNLDMLEAMKTSALFQKAWRMDSAAMPLDELLSAATGNGAKALGMDTGRIEEGALADILIVDTRNTFFLSPGSFLANFVYSAHSDCIDSVICGGRFVMEHREVAGREEILEGARKVLKQITV